MCVWVRHALAFHRSGLESSKVEIEVFARRFFFNYKVIKKTESKESLADLLEHSETRVYFFFFFFCFTLLSRRDTDDVAIGIIQQSSSNS